MGKRQSATAARPRLSSGQIVCWIGFGTGSAVSIAANVLDARITPAWVTGAQQAHDQAIAMHAPFVPPAPIWSPNIFAQAFAPVWPILLIISVEMLSRVRWPSRLLWITGRAMSTIGIALFSAAISYSHISDVLLALGNTWAAAHAGPLVIDGAMTLAGFGLLAETKARAEERTDQPARTPPATTTKTALSGHRWSRRQPAVVSARSVAPTDAPGAVPPEVTTPSTPGASVPARASGSSVTSIQDGVDRRTRMFDYLDAHPDATGADLDREFHTNNYGRSVRNAWRKQRAMASGE